MLTASRRAGTASGAPRSGAVTALLIAAIVTGCLLGAFAPAAGETLGSAVDPLILLLVGLLVFTLRLDGLGELRRAHRPVLLVLAVNFLLVPVIAWTLTSLLPDEALRLGVLLYCLAPCTDWVLGFIRLAGGDTRIGVALIPIQMALQLALYPVWLALFAGERSGATVAGAGGTLLTWFVLPAAIALILRAILRLAVSEHARRGLVDVADLAVPVVIASVIVALFAANVGTILADPASFAWVLLVVFLFFAVTFALGEGVARAGGLPVAERALLTMTTSARNAPLMLALTAAALPDQPVVLAAIVLGMLVEFPHLTALTWVLRRPGRTAGVGGGRTSDGRGRVGIDTARS